MRACSPVRGSKLRLVVVCGVGRPSIEAGKVFETAERCDGLWCAAVKRCLNAPSLSPSHAEMVKIVNEHWRDGGKWF